MKTLAFCVGGMGCAWLLVYVIQMIALLSKGVQISITFIGFLIILFVGIVIGIIAATVWELFSR
jgi:hypothetical protein